MQSYFVTGGNRGIGLAIVRQLLRQQKEVQDSVVFLGTRNLEKGLIAKSQLLTANKWIQDSRIKVVQLDVTEKESITNAACEITKELNGRKLNGLINNSGVFGQNSMQQILDVNVRGTLNVIESFFPLLSAENSSVVNLGSILGAQFLHKCNPESKKVLVGEGMELDEYYEIIESLMKKLTKEFDDSKLKGKISQEFLNLGVKGIKNGDSKAAYSFSKALIHAISDKQNEVFGNMKVQAVHPGFVMTDMTMHFANGDVEKAKDMGMISAEDGARTVVRKLFE